jgi:hypothetical protein
MHETSSRSDRSRTLQNVIESDGTVIFGGALLAGGSPLTKRLCEELGKPYLVLDFPTANDQRKRFTDWAKSPPKSLVWRSHLTGCA